MQTIQNQVKIENLKKLVRTIPNFPKPGIMFRDVTTLFADPYGLSTTVSLIAQLLAVYMPRKLVAIESRGFILGGALAKEMGTGLVLARKKGKLPGDVVRINYELEYGTDTIEMHRDAIIPGESCIVVDDLLATGGTCSATCDLVESLGGHVAACAFVINLPELQGHKRLQRYPVHWLMDFAGH